MTLRATLSRLPVMLCTALLACSHDPTDEPGTEAGPVTGGPGGGTDAGTSAHPDAGQGAAPDAAGPGGNACTFDHSIAALSAHNTSASASYEQVHFAANFGTSTWTSQAGATTPVDPSKTDLSLNPVTPGHVSAVDVHSLIPTRPDLRWFAHLTPWFHAGGGGGHVDIGLHNASAEYVAAMVDDVKRRGFDGVIIDWYGKDSYTDQVTQLLKANLATRAPGDFTYIVMMDAGISGLSASVLKTQVEYVQSAYFSDAHYEREAGEPILMFFGVDGKLGGDTMASVKAQTGGAMTWVKQGTGSLDAAWVDQAFDWTHDFHDGASTTDPCNLGGIAGFYATMAHATKPAFGSMAPGFNGMLTHDVAWSKGKYLPRRSGACWAAAAQKIDTVIPANVTRMQVATWSDWEEGSSIEGGIENDASVVATASGTKLAWAVTTGSNDETTIDHYAVYASIDGEAAVLLGEVPAGTHEFDLAASPCTLTKGEQYKVFVNAVGKASIRDHVSNAVSFGAP